MKFELGQSGQVNVVRVSDSCCKLEKISLLADLSAKGIFEGKKNQVYFDYQSEGESTLYVGVGKKDKINLETLRQVYHTVGKQLTNYKVESANIDTTKFDKTQLQAVVEGLLQSQSVFDKYLTTKKFNPTVETIYLSENPFYDVVDAARDFLPVYEGIEITRELVNERPMHLYPETLAQHAKNVLEPVGVKVTILDKDAITALEMDALLAVSLGSDKEPRFIVMEYNGNTESDYRTALVGKGVTYDTGGYSLKPSTSMDTMFSDMAGSATVIGAIYAIAKAKLPHNVTALVAATENDVNGSAFKPGDIISSMSKKTIEVLNTDAEGRLTLADSLWYAHDVVKADQIIDLATLTGACIVALGEVTTAAITNNQDLVNDVLKASEVSGEPTWQLPALDIYRDMVKSDYADLLNTSKGKGAGTITAAMFLENFVNDTPWVHLDIAGTAYQGSARGYLPQGATGAHVKTLFNFIKNQK
ncbi:MAG: leucyl aminopeptidase [Erysipelothrix sp.]|nr:leucyl aminopeptidase [Erysipelothrix sp.]